MTLPWPNRGAIAPDDCLYLGIDDFSYSVDLSPRHLGDIAVGFKLGTDLDLDLDPASRRAQSENRVQRGRNPGREACQRPGRPEARGAAPSMPRPAALDSTKQLRQRSVGSRTTRQ